MTLAQLSMFLPATVSFCIVAIGIWNAISHYIQTGVIDVVGWAPNERYCDGSPRLGKIGPLPAATIGLPTYVAGALIVYHWYVTVPVILAMGIAYYYIKAARKRVAFIQTLQGKGE